MTLSVQMILRAFVLDPTVKRYGLDLHKETGLTSGALYPILARLEAAGWLQSQWEVIATEEVGRPRRRYYQLTSNGTQQARAALTDGDDAWRHQEGHLSRARPRLGLAEAQLTSLF